MHRADGTHTHEHARDRDVSSASAANDLTSLTASATPENPTVHSRAASGVPGASDASLCVEAGSASTTTPTTFASAHASELPRDRSADIAVAFDRLVAARQARLQRVLDAHKVPSTVRDSGNVLCGLKGVRFFKGKGGNRDVWMVAKRAFESLSHALGELPKHEGGEDELEQTDNEMELTGDGQTCSLRTEVGCPDARGLVAAVIVVEASRRKRELIELGLKGALEAILNHAAQEGRQVVEFCMLNCKPMTGVHLAIVVAQETAGECHDGTAVDD